MIEPSHKPASLLILGGRGCLGSALSLMSWPRTWRIRSVSHQTLDITIKTDISRFFEKESATFGPFDYVINAAAFLPVDKAEGNPEKALNVNGLALQNIAEVCNTYGSLLVHFSTEQVFDGSGRRALCEDDPKNPLNVYGRSKHIGDLILETVNIPYITLRTSWLFGLHCRSFVQKIWQLSDEVRTIDIVDDQIACSTYIGDLCDALLSILTQHNQDQNKRKPLGVFHICGKDEISWFGFAQAVLEAIKPHQIPRLKIRPITTKAYREKNPFVAARPLYAPLNCRKIEKAYGIKQTSFKHHLPRCIKAFEEKNCASMA